MADVLEPAIRAQVAALRGCQEFDFHVEEFRRGSEFSQYCDRFVLTVPCCLERLRWNVIYNATKPRVPPDIVFGHDDAGEFQPLVSTEEDSTKRLHERALAMLRSWNVHDAYLLLRFILILRELYLRHQEKLVNEVPDPRIHFEMRTLAVVKGVELFLVGSPDKPEEVQMSIPLGDIDFSSLRSLLERLTPPAQHQEQGAEAMKRAQMISLQMKYPVARGLQKTPPVTLQVKASPTVLEVLNLAETKLPGWTETTCLLEYLPQLHMMIQQLVVDARAALDLRRAFLNALPQLFGWPLECDPMYCRRATVYLTCNALGFLVHFSLPSQFPKQQPKLTFQSVQHFDAVMRPVLSKPLDDYPWSPRWEPEEMVRRICLFIQDEAPNFKRHCMETVQRR